MKPTTIFKAMMDAQEDWLFIASLRRGRDRGIAIATDRLARKWQKRDRQIKKFRKSVFRSLGQNEQQLERAAVIMQWIFDDGEGGRYRGDINNFLVDYDHGFKVSK